MNKKITKLMAALALLVFMAPSMVGWGQVPSAAPANGYSYVVAYYANNKYYALPHGTSANVWDATEVSLNSVNKVDETAAASLAWTLTEGSTSGQFYLTYTSGTNTYYLYKNGGTSNSNYNIKGTTSTSERHYWEFTLNTNNNSYAVKSLKANTGNTIYLGYATVGKFGVYSDITNIILLEIGNVPTVPYTVTLGDDNTTLTETSAGAGVTLPSRSDVYPYTFVGWSLTNLTEETTTATIIPAGEYHPAADITLYPVYSRTESGATTWTKVVSSNVAGHPSGITEGVYALLTGSDKAFNGVISNGHGQSTTDAFVFTDNVATNTPTGTCEITMIPVMNGDAVLGYKMYNAEYGYLYASAASSGNLAWHDSEESYWSYSNYDWCYKSNTAHLRVYNDSFRTYGNSTGSQIKVARKGTVTTTYYISVVSPAQEYTLTVTATENVEIYTFVGESTEQGIEGNIIQQVYSGTTVGLSVFASEGYELTLTVDGDNVTSQLDDSGWYEFIMPTHDVTVTATATAIPMALYTYSINGVEGEAMEVAVGSTIDLQAGADLNSDFTFAGWTTDPNDVSQPLTSFTFDEEEVYVFYAVYGKTIADSPATTVYQKVITAPTNGDWSGDYLIVYDNGIVLDSHDGNLNVNTFGTYEDISEYYDNGEIEYNSITSAFEITAEKTSNGYSLYDNDDEAFLGFNSTGNSNTGAKLRWDAEFATSRNEWTLGVGSIVSVFNNERAIRWNDNSGSYRFAIYALSGQEPIQLFKKTTVAQTTTTYYTRVFLNETVTDDIVIVGPSIIPNGQMLDMGEDYIIENNLASNLVIEDGGQLYSVLAVEATVQKHIIGRNSNGGWNFVASPICFEADPSTVGMINGDYDLYRFNPLVELDAQGKTYEWENYKVHSTDGFSLYNGHGYLYANLNDVDLVFAGTVNDPAAISSYDYDSEALSNLREWHLVGNPYMYEAYPNMSYYVVSGSGIAEPEISGAVAPCEGIMIQGTDGLVNFTRTPENATQPSNLQMTLAQQVINRGTVSSTKLDKAIISFNEGSQLGKFYLGESTANIYIPQANEEYAVVSSEPQGEMPVNFRAAENGTYTLTVNPEGVEMNYLHLIDNMTGMDVDLLQTPSYTFNATTRDYESRFRLVFAANNEDGASAGSTAFAFFSNGNWIINNAGEATLQVIDLTGRILSSETVNGSVSKTINATPGVYMLRLINGENVNVQKIVVR